MKLQDKKVAVVWIAAVFNVTENFAYERLNRYYQKSFYFKEVVYA